MYAKILGPDQMFLKEALMPLVKCQINNSPAGRGPSSDISKALWRMGHTDHCALCRGKQSQGLSPEEREREHGACPAVFQPQPSLFVCLPCKALLSSGSATGPGSTNMLTYSKSSWLPSSLLPPSAENYYMEFKRGREPSRAIVV